MYIVFRYLLIIRDTEIQVWPDLREAHDATCNKGVSRADLAAKFPHLDFSRCPEHWDFPAHTPGDATVRAERVRQRVSEIAKAGKYKDIVLVTHRGFAAFMVQGERFSVCGKNNHYYEVGSLLMVCCRIQILPICEYRRD
jgi:broad specificity phosphatase PhoE